MSADLVVEKRRVDLPPEVFARLPVDGQRLGVTVAATVRIATMFEPREPEVMPASSKLTSVAVSPLELSMAQRTDPRQARECRLRPGGRVWSDHGGRCGDEVATTTRR